MLSSQKVINVILNNMLRSIYKRPLKSVFQFIGLALFVRNDLRVVSEPRDPERVVAGMATIPSRAHTFDLAYASLIRNVDHMYVYLDGHQDVPEIVRGDPRVTAIFSRDMPGLHANGKFIGLVMEKQDCFYICADDDIYFSGNFIHRMRQALALYQDKAVVGLHGSRLARPLVRYYQNRALVAHYKDALEDSTIVDVLGTGAVMFSTSEISFDVRDWPRVSMADLGLAIEAAKRRVPLYCIARDSSVVTAIEGSQADSLYRARKKDDTLQTKLGKELLGLGK